MFRLPSLSWTSFGADKVTPESVKFANAKPRKMPSTDPAKMQKLKRKRAESGTSDTGHQRPPAKKLDQQPRVVIPRPVLPAVAPKDAPLAASIESRQAEPPTPSPTNDGDSAEERVTPPASATSASERSSLTEKQLAVFHSTIKSQFSLEILMKHNELRLIDQEIAKCQIALEQLRRCREIPYPGFRLSEDVSYGKGPPLRSKMLIPPEVPPPWGVTDGPYSRHYAKWLLPDQRFDGSDTFPQPGNLHAGKSPTKGRSTRGSFTDPDVGARAGRLRGGPGSKMQSLPTGYPAPRDKAGPMIQKRKSDGVMVKLVCLDCRRDNFSSAQGFINHCRIAHNRSFASHDAAADASGEPVEVDETGAVVGGDVQPTGTAGLVHPLIRSAHLLKKELNSTNENTSGTPVPAPSKSEDGKSSGLTEAVSTHQASRTPAKPKRGRKAKETPANPSSFKPSPLTPHLSDLMRGRGSVLDLYDIVGEARAPMDIHESSSSESEEDDEESSTPLLTPGRLSIRGAGMQPVHSSVASQGIRRPENRMKLEKDHRPRRLDNITSSVHHPSGAALAATQLDGSTDIMDIEPSPTNDSNQAPSLVDDDEEYEEHSSSETSSSSSGSNGDLDVEVEDDESTSGAQSARSSGEDSEFSHAAKQAPTSQPRKASALRTGLAKREEKHVTFVSPSPVREMVKKRGGRRKKTE